MEPIITYAIIAVTCITSFMAFNNHQLIDDLIFWPYAVWRKKEWHRLLTCGFIHADLGHLFFNMFALFSFGQYMEAMFHELFGVGGLFMYATLYLGAIAGADIYNLFTRRDDYNYRSLGASGGVSAVIFAFILLNPFGHIGIIFLPGGGIPAFVFGPLYLVYCAFMAKRGGDNVGHIAHFTGSVFGFIFPILFRPQLLIDFFEKIRAGL